MGKTLNFETSESLIEELFQILRSLATPDQVVYMNIISDDNRDGVQWNYNPSELTEDIAIVFPIYFRTEPRTSLAERCLVNLGERR
jgi:hypothetical protein